MVTPRIRPVPDGLTQRFWDAAAWHRLELQRCDDCGRVNHPPQALCGHCGSSGLRFAEVAGAGVVYSWTSALRRPGAGTAPETDTETLLVVALGGDPDALLCGHVDGRPGWVEIGAPVTVTFGDLDYTGADGERHTVTLPDFVPAPRTATST